MKFNFRAVLHRTTNGSSHLDIFLQIPGQDSLVTYEAPADFFRGDLLSSIHMTAGPVSDGVPVRRKGDHRTHYWTFSGNLTENRGSVEEAARGIIDFPDFESLPIFPENAYLHRENKLLN